VSRFLYCNRVRCQSTGRLSFFRAADLQRQLLYVAFLPHVSQQDCSPFHGLRTSCVICCILYSCSISVHKTALPPFLPPSFPHSLPLSLPSSRRPSLPPSFPLVQVCNPEGAGAAKMSHTVPWLPLLGSCLFCRSYFHTASVFKHLIGIPHTAPQRRLGVLSPLLDPSFDQLRLCRW
jgi:hypothetical protein